MKIAMISPWLDQPYGTELSLLTSAKLLREAGHEALVLGGNSGKYDMDLPELDHFTFFTKKEAIQPLLDRMMAFLEKEQPDVVHFHTTVDPRFLRAVSARFPVCLTLHLFSLTCPASTRWIEGVGMCRKKSGPQCLAHTLRYGCLDAFPSALNRAVVVADHFIKRWESRNFFLFYVSEVIKRALLDDGWSEEQMQSVPNVVEVHETKPPLPVPANLIVHASRLTPAKGASMLIDALEKIKELEWTLWICGDGAEKQNLEAQVQRAGLEERIVFKGHVPREELMRMLRAARCFVQPNLSSEAFGLSVAEAVSLAASVIVPDIGAFNEFVDKTRGHFLFPVGDNNALINCLMEALTEERPQAKLDEAAITLLELHSTTSHLNALLKGYEACLKASGKNRKMLSSPERTPRTLQSSSRR